MICILVNLTVFWKLLLFTFCALTEVLICQLTAVFDSCLMKHHKRQFVGQRSVSLLFCTTIVHTTQCSCIMPREECGSVWTTVMSRR